MTFSIGQRSAGDDADCDGRDGAKPAGRPPKTSPVEEGPGVVKRGSADRRIDRRRRQPRPMPCTHSHDGHFRCQTLRQPSCQPAGTSDVPALPTKATKPMCMCVLSRCLEAPPAAREHWLFAACLPTSTADGRLDMTTDCPTCPIRSRLLFSPTSCFLQPSCLDDTRTLSFQGNEHSYSKNIKLITSSMVLSIMQNTPRSYPLKQVFKSIRPPFNDHVSHLAFIL
uniref:Secreted protein n=1 Tax=Panagrellus redivivus TaxID=6233 RepID=A0A7E4W9W4_PANRE